MLGPSQNIGTISPLDYCQKNRTRRVENVRGCFGESSSKATHNSQLPTVEARARGPVLSVSLAVLLYLKTSSQKESNLYNLSSTFRVHKSTRVLRRACSLEINPHTYNGFESFQYRLHLACIVKFMPKENGT